MLFSVFVLQYRDGNSATLLVHALLIHGSSSGEHMQSYKTTGDKCLQHPKLVYEGACVHAREAQLLLHQS